MTLVVRIEIWWHKNGQKMSVKNFKDGKKEGLETYWHENGEAWYERNYKDGKRVELNELPERR